MHNITDQICQNVFGVKLNYNTGNPFSEVKMNFEENKTYIILYLFVVVFSRFLGGFGAVPGFFYFLLLMALIKSIFFFKIHFF